MVHPYRTSRPLEAKTILHQPQSIMQTLLNNVEVTSGLVINAFGTFCIGKNAILKQLKHIQKIAPCMAIENMKVVLK